MTGATSWSCPPDGCLVTDSVSRETPPAPDAARGVFADRFGLAQAYVGWLADAGTVRGLIGPREVPRLWERHVLNCAVVAEALPPVGAAHRVADIGSGAGLPGLVLAIVRPDLEFTLIEPLLRRTTFLSEVVADLGLDNVLVHRGRAEDFAVAAGGDPFDVVTSRAVAPLERLGAWSLPLVRVGGTFLPMKGASAGEELDAARPSLRALGADDGELLTVGQGVVQEPVTVIRLGKMSEPTTSSPGRRRRTNRRRR